MKELFEKYKIELTDEKEKKFREYSSLLKEYNSKFNLTSILSDEQIEIKHFLDSCLYVDKFIHNADIIEIGSGGGFPSIPNKILREDLNFTLVEATEKKCEFLSVVVKKLNLKNVRIINGRAEELGNDKIYREKYDYCIARAVARLNVLSEYCMPFVKVNGKFVAYKGNAAEETEEAKSAIDVLGGKITNVYEFSLPNDEGKRNVIEIEKIKNTPSLYPRANGKIKKKPL